MLVGCGCQCTMDSQSHPASGAQSGDWSGSFPSQSSWPESIPPSEPYAPQPCTACIAGVRATAYRVTLGKPGMTQRTPTQFGDWGCAEMLQPFRVQMPPFAAPGGDLLFPQGSYGPGSCFYGTQKPPYTPPPLGSPVDCTQVVNGQFVPRDGIATMPCATKPACSVRFKTISEADPQQYVAQLILEFRGMVNCSPTSVPDMREYLQVFYETPIVTSKFACMSRIALTWKTAYGNRERRNPDPQFPFQMESWGIGPGNNVSYEFHRGTFPETIFIEPWRTV
jgi:hypothetical protein